MPTLSDGWGMVVGGAFPLCWAASLAFFTGYSRDPVGRAPQLPAAVIWAMLPLALAWPLARTSTQVCDPHLSRT